MNIVNPDLRGFMEKNMSRPSTTLRTGNEAEARDRGKPVSAIHCALASLRATCFSCLVLGLLASTVFAAAPAPTTAPAQSPQERYIANELTFADKLNTELRMPGYALKVLDALIAKYPETKSRAQMIRIASLAMQNKFEEAQKELATLPASSPEQVAGTLSLGDVYYVNGNLAKAREIYEGFLGKYPDGPPTEIKEFYLRSADRYIQMLTQRGDDAGALKACRAFLKADPDPELARNCKMQMAELCLRSARSGQDRDALLKESQTLCEDLMWGEQDLVFAKCVVILAHVHLEKGERDEAKAIIEDNMNMLRSVDDDLRKQRISLGLSPMAECRFLLGTMFEEDGRALLDKSDDKKGLGLLGKALDHLFTICTKYGESRWAPDAAKHAEELVNYLKEKGHEVTIPKSVNLNTVADAQLKSARELLASSDWAGAKQAYLQVLSQFPSIMEKPNTLSALAQACIQDKDTLYASAFILHIAERFHSDAASENAAGNALIALATQYSRAGDTTQSINTLQLYLDHFPKHTQAPLISFKVGDTYLTRKDYAQAEPYFRRIVEGYSNAPGYADALSRLATCQMSMRQYSNAVALLTRYANSLPPCSDKADALLRVANALRESSQTIAALKQYIQLQGLLKKSPGNLYYASQTPEDAARNAKTLQRAIFWTGNCFSLLTKPPEKVAAYRQKAVDSYVELLKDPTLKELGPPTLAALGTLYFLQDKADLADKTFRRLATDYPDAPEAKNALFTQGRSLLKINQSKRAVEVFQRMFDDPKAYKPAQFYQVGLLMSEAGQHETAVKAFSNARDAGNEPLWNSATIGMSRSLVELGKNTEALEATDAILTKNPNTPYAVPVYQVRARAYGNLMQAETGDEKAKFALYQKALTSLTEVRKRSKNALVLATAELDLADIQTTLGQKKEAIASLQRFLLFADFNNKALAPSVESAFEKLMPLLVDVAMYKDAVDAAQQYLAHFPSGSYSRDVRKWRDEAASKMTP